MVRLPSLVEYLDSFLSLEGHPDYRTALNGLQVQGREEVCRIAAAVDTSEAVIRHAADAGADVLLVHHGLFWDGLRPLTGRRYRKVAALLEAGMGLYSAHLPLDARFGEFEGAPIGWYGTPSEWDRSALVERFAQVLGGPVHLLDGGPETVRRVAVVTGGGGSFIEAAAAAGVDTLVTGEGSHHTFVDAHELGVNVVFGGHYRTEVFGVKALAEHLAEMFSLDWVFLDHPSGL